MAGHSGCESFDFLRGLVYRHSGIHLAEKEAGILRARVNRRLKELSLPSADAYVRLLTSPEGEQELPSLIDAVTTNYTFFFRESEHFQFLCGEALPRTLARKAHQGSRKLRLWSAGCSSGEEPYSLAICVADALEGLEGWDARILAGDINRAVLACASPGVYPKSKLARVPPEYFYRYLIRDAQTPPGCLRLSDEIRRMVVFRRQNILREESSFRGRFDLIFCRHVMIYFDGPTRAALLRYFLTCLCRGGYLFVAPREVIHAVPPGLAEVAPQVYRRE